ncbi:MAG: hypothetical protein LBQ20_03920 [Rhodanobacter sp.]|jgi:phosphoserine phosphatase|nr:hypothetical protein [Rhodanobacter sp.]
MHDHDIPLCVDLDGTLIRTDLTVESLFAFIGRNPLDVFRVLAWRVRGWAHMKREVARRVCVDAASLPYDERVLELVRAAGGRRRRVLCTASDQIVADAVAAHLGLFDEVLGSDGVRSLGGRGKRDELVARYGERGFDYAGNATVDLQVWRHARQAIVVNAPPRLVARVRRECAVERVLEWNGHGTRAWLRALRNPSVRRSAPQ